MKIDDLKLLKDNVRVQCCNCEKIMIVGKDKYHLMSKPKLILFDEEEIEEDLEFNVVCEECHNNIFDED